MNLTSNRVYYIENKFAYDGMAKSLRRFSFGVFPLYNEHLQINTQTFGQMTSIYIFGYGIQSKINIT